LRVTCTLKLVSITYSSLGRYFESAVHLMQVVARAAGHRHLSDFTIEDLTTFKTDIAQLTSVEYGGVAPLLHTE
jgi:hypothetical protein